MPFPLKLPPCARCGHPWSAHRKNFCTHRPAPLDWNFVAGDYLTTATACACFGGPYSAAQEDARFGEMKT